MPRLARHHVGLANAPEQLAIGLFLGLTLMYFYYFATLLLFVFTRYVVYCHYCPYSRQNNCITWYKYVPHLPEFISDVVTRGATLRYVSVVTYHPCINHTCSSYITTGRTRNLSRSQTKLSLPSCWCTGFLKSIPSKVSKTLTHACNTSCYKRPCFKHSFKLWLTVTWFTAWSFRESE